MRRWIFCSTCAYASLALLVLSPSALAATDVQGVIDNLKVWLMGFLASLAMVFLIVGGARYVMAGGDPVRIEKAKGAIASAGLGFAFALFAPAAITIIQKIVGG
jgi:hypothetical protein